MYRECMTAVWQRWKPGVVKPGRPATSLYSPHIRSRVFELIRKDNIRRHFRYGGRTEGSSSSSTRIPIPNRVSIDDRSAHANGQTVGGQGDGHDRRKERQGAVVTLVERERCFMLMEKLYSGKRSVPPAHVIVKTTQRERDACKDHTNNGTEFAAHEIIARELGTTVYFAHPYCSWEKGAIENMNGLVRQYIPKRTNFREFQGGQANCIEIQQQTQKENGFSKPADR